MIQKITLKFLMLTLVAVPAGASPSCLDDGYYHQHPKGCQEVLRVEKIAKDFLQNKVSFLAGTATFNGPGVSRETVRAAVLVEHRAPTTDLSEMLISEGNVFFEKRILENVFELARSGNGGNYSFANVVMGFPRSWQVELNGQQIQVPQAGSGGFLKVEYDVVSKRFNCATCSAQVFHVELDLKQIEMNSVSKVVSNLKSYSSMPRYAYAHEGRQPLLGIKGYSGGLIAQLFDSLQVGFNGRSSMRTAGQDLQLFSGSDGHVYYQFQPYTVLFTLDAQGGGSSFLKSNGTGVL